MSIGSVTVTPTPTAAPLTAAMTGFVQRKMRSVHAPADRRDAPRPARSRSSPARVEGLAAAAEIRSRAEAASRAGHDHDAHVVVRVDVVESLEPVVAHRAG